jgi:hypothetical protein
MGDVSLAPAKVLRDEINLGAAFTRAFGLGVFDDLKALFEAL